MKLRCPVKGWPTPNITWVKDGVPIEDISRPAHIRPYQLKSEKWELKIHGLLKSDQGKFTCIIENSEGRIKHTFQVDVLDYISDKPKLVSQTSNLTLLQGMTANFQCKFESDLAIFVYWLRPVKALRNSAGNNENAILDGSNKTHFETIQDKPGHNYVGENFTIKNVPPEDAGWYFCVGTTNAGRETGNCVTQKRIILTIRNDLFWIMTPLSYFCNFVLQYSIKVCTANRYIYNLCIH